MPFRPPPPSLNDSASGAWVRPAAAKLSPDDEETAEQYRKMLKMGMSEGAVTQKMQMYGVGQHIIDAVFPEEEEPEPEPKATPAVTEDSDDDAAALFNMAGSVPAAKKVDESQSLTGEEEEMVEKYKKMFKMGMPEGAVIQKMSVDEVPKHVQDAVLAPTPEPAQSGGLTTEEEEMVEKYKKMFKMGMPEGAVIQKMSVDEVPKHVQDAVLAPAPEPEQSGGLTPEEEEMVTRYKKMFNMGMPEGAVIQKMSVDEVPKHVQDAVLAPGPQEDAPVIKDEASKTETVSEEATLTEDEQEMVTKYKNMFKMGMPKGAVVRKMDTDDVPEHVRKAVLTSLEGEPDPSKKVVLTEAEEEMKTMYKKMIKMGMPEGAVAQKMKTDEVPQHIQDAVLAPEETEQVKEELKETSVPLPVPVASEPATDVTAGMPMDGNDAEGNAETQEVFEEEYFSEESMAEDEETYEEEYEDEEVLEDSKPILQEPNDNLASLGEDEKDEKTESSPPQAAGMIAIRERDDLPEPSDDLQDLPEPSDPISETQDAFEDEHPMDEEEGDGYFEDVEDEVEVEEEENIVASQPQLDEEVGTRTYQASKATAATNSRARRKHPDQVFHRLVFLAYVLMIGGGIAVCLYFLVFEDDENDSSPTPKGTPTTPLAPIDSDTCDFSDVDMPHVIDQCRCNGTISIIAEDVEQRYERHLEEFVPLIYQNYDESISSCSVRNQALVWLSTANDFQFSEAARSERFALANLFIGTKGAEWTESENWLSEAPACNWYGITCSAGKVNKIELSSNNLDGPIPSEILILLNLSSLELSGNVLNGPIPKEVFFLTLLKFLFLQDNQFEGEIPLTIQQATSLEEIDLSSNNLGGTIPDEIEKATSLANLNLADNGFRGSIPSSVFALPDLKSLQLQSNQLEGSIPSSISRASSLIELNLSSNYLVGSMPSSLGSLTSLERLFLQNLDLDGILPGNLFEKLSNMIQLVIAETGINGSLPSSLGRMSNIEILDLHANRFREEIPDEIGKLDTLEILDLSGNFFSGAIPTELGDLSTLIELRLNDNSFTGSIPGALGGLNTLETLTLDGNLIQGSVPSRVCDLRDESLNEFIVDCKTVDCEIPECCTSCRD